jgi:carboxyl-terminal processing protease
MRLTLKQIRKAVFILFLMFLAGGIGFWWGRNQAGLSLFQRPAVKLDRQGPVDKQELKFDLFWQVWDELEASFFDKEKLDPVRMVYGAIAGLVSSLGDPYTVFLTPEQNQRALEDLAGAFDGIGIQLGFIDHHLAVIAPLSGSPAQRAGIRAGDLILKIDDQETSEITLPQAVDLIRGEKGTVVSLTLFRQGEEESFEIRITRDIIVVKSVEVEFLDDWCSGASGCSRVAYLKLMRFGDRTNQEWDQAVGQIKSRCGDGDQECLGVVLDVRNNPGGYLSGSVFIVSEFLSSGVVVQQEMGDGSKETFSVNRRGELLEIPLVVLVNKGSASASEIVAGALKEGQRAKIVGEITFGKGTIQESQDLEGGAGLHITAAQWLLASGLSIEGEGLAPDFEVENDPDQPEKDFQLEKAIEILSQME